MTTPPSAPVFCVPTGRTARGQVRVPGSKSIAQRALVAGCLADGVTRLRNVPTSEDLRVLVDALRELGASIEPFAVTPGGDRGGRPNQTGLDVSGFEIIGFGDELPGGERSVDLGENGTALRLVTALATLRPGRTLIRGVPHRPLAPLLSALHQLGARVVESHEGTVRCVVDAAPVRGGTVRVSARESSQFATALLLVGARLPEGVQVELEGDVVSRSYLELTTDVLRRFEVQCIWETPRRVTVSGSQRARAATIEVEPDASAAAFYLSAAAITGGEVSVLGSLARSSQGDSKIGEFLEAMGCVVERADDRLTVRGRATRPLGACLRSHPDLAPALAAVAAFVDGQSVFSDLGHLRHKESNRLEGLVDALRGVGVSASCDGDQLKVVGQSDPSGRGRRLDPHGDHRMAMAFALLGLRIPGVEIESPGVVAKSDPDFYERLGSLFPDPSSWRVPRS